MHWSQMVEFWGRPLLEANPRLSEARLVAEICTATELVDVESTDQGALVHSAGTLADHGYPEPDEPHPISSAVQSRQVQAALTTVGGRCAVTPLVHGYGPADDFERRLRVVAESDADGVWINRYGYLSGAKLAAIGRVWGG
jgi:hypothetical protein